MTRQGGEVPTFAASSYASHTIDMTGSGATPLWSPDTGGAGGFQGGHATGGMHDAFEQAFPLLENAEHRARWRRPTTMPILQPQEDAMAKSPLRVVRVFLVDPDDRIPLEKRVLHSSGEITTDATDQELYFSIPVQELLWAHNAYRATVRWKDEGSKGEPEPLKEIRIRDLVMSVTTVASFPSRGA